MKRYFRSIRSFAAFLWCSCKEYDVWHFLISVIAKFPFLRRHWEGDRSQWDVSILVSDRGGLCSDNHNFLHFFFKLCKVNTIDFQGRNFKEFKTIFIRIAPIKSLKFFSVTRESEISISTSHQLSLIDTQFKKATYQFKQHKIRHSIHKNPIKKWWETLRMWMPLTTAAV